MIEKHLLDWFCEKYISLIKKYPIEFDEIDYIELLTCYKMDFVNLEDGYNSRFKNYSILILDNYGDDNPIQIMDTEDYNNDNYWKRFKIKRPSLDNVRLDVLTSVCLVDNKLDCSLIDIKTDLSYEIKEYKNKLNKEVPKELLHLIFGGKRAYYWCKDSISLKFHEQYEEYLKSIGLEKEQNREGNLTSHRIIIGR